jgi:hypothetical protein
MRSAMACAAIHFSQPLFHSLGVGNENGCAILSRRSRDVAATCAGAFAVLWCYDYGRSERAADCMVSISVEWSGRL